MGAPARFVLGGRRSAAVPSAYGDPDTSARLSDFDADAERAYIDALSITDEDVDAAFDRLVAHADTRRDCCPYCDAIAAMFHAGLPAGPGDRGMGGRR